LRIRGLDGRAASDQFLDDLGAPAPRGHMQRRAFLCDIPIPIARAIDRSRVYPRIEQLADTCEISDTGEMGEERSSCAITADLR